LIRRVFAAAAVYALSIPALLMMLATIGGEFRTPRAVSLVSLVWLTAWALHVGMCVTWVFDRRLHKAWVWLGLALGVLSFVLWPLLTLGDGVPIDEALQVSAQLMGVQLVLVSPATLLAGWLVRFHLTAPPAEGTDIEHGRAQ